MSLDLSIIPSLTLNCSDILNSIATVGRLPIHNACDPSIATAGELAPARSLTSAKSSPLSSDDPPLTHLEPGSQRIDLNFESQDCSDPGLVQIAGALVLPYHTHELGTLPLHSSCDPFNEENPGPGADSLYPPFAANLLDPVFFDDTVSVHQLSQWPQPGYDDLSQYVSFISLPKCVSDHG